VQENLVTATNAALSIALSYQNQKAITVLPAQNFHVNDFVSWINDIEQITE